MALQELASPPQGGSSAADPQTLTRLRSQLLREGRELLTTVGNQSNLILDPDLDSYYVMSLVVLRFPELLQAVHDTVSFLNAGAIAARAAVVVRAADAGGAAGCG